MKGDVLGETKMDIWKENEEDKDKEKGVKVNDWPDMLKINNKFKKQLARQNQKDGVRWGRSLRPPPDTKQSKTKTYKNTKKKKLI